MSHPKRVLFIYLALALVTLAVYWPVTSHEFVSYDDNEYVTENPDVQAGLSWHGVVWAFTTGHASNWHPLTWLSHMLDCQLFGMDAGGPHLVNLLFHIANTLLFFALWRHLLGSDWKAGFIAALFAWHPLHVESVAWISERKDVLSTFFWLLTIMAYVRYCRAQETGGQGVNAIKLTKFNRQPEQQKALRLPVRGFGNWMLFIRSRRNFRWYLLTLLLFVLALLSKPMVVTLPFVLLLLDFWPLKRVASGILHLPVAEQNARPQVSAVGVPGSLSPTDGLGLESGNPAFAQASVGRLVLEKLPLFALTLVASLVTYFVQRAGGAVQIQNLPFYARLGTSLTGYLRYLGKIFWPCNLVPFYPYEKVLPLWQVIGAGAVLMVISALAIKLVRRKPDFAVGWFWFLGILVPVIGIIKMGNASIADRYTYVPAIGVFLLVANGLAGALAQWRWHDAVLGAAATFTLAACLMLTQKQIGYWSNSLTLFRHGDRNALAEGYLALSLVQEGRILEAMPHYSNSLSMVPNDYRVQNNLAIALAKLKRWPEATNHYAISIRLKPRDGMVHFNYATSLGMMGNFEAAISEYYKCLALRPDLPEAHLGLGVALAKQARYEEALAELGSAAGLRPDYRDAFRAIHTVSFQREMYLVQSTRGAESLAHLRAALRLEPDSTTALNNLAWALATDPDATLRDGPEAVRVAEKACQLTGNKEPFFLGTLAAAYAEAGRFPDAIQTARRARDLAVEARLENVARKNRELLLLYNAGKPFHEALEP